MKSILRMSFYDGSWNKEKAKAIIETTNKEIKYRYGFAYRGANASPISKERALEIIKKGGFIDLDEYENEIVINTYSTNDMF